MVPKLCVRAPNRGETYADKNPIGHRAILTGHSVSWLLTPAIQKWRWLRVCWWKQRRDARCQVSDIRERALNSQVQSSQLPAPRISRLVFCFLTPVSFLSSRFGTTRAEESSVLSKISMIRKLLMEFSEISVKSQLIEKKHLRGIFQIELSKKRGEIQR